MFVNILQHIPHQVCIILAILIAIGLSQSYPRRASVWRATIIPVVMIVLSFHGVISAFPLQPAALIAWALGVALALYLSNAMGAWSTIRWSASDRHFLIPGSWIPMALILGIFSIKFGVGMTLAMQPEFAAIGLFAALVCFAYGIFSGVFLGRAAAMWKIAHRAFKPEKGF